MILPKLPTAESLGAVLLAELRRQNGFCAMDTILHDLAVAALAMDDAKESQK